MGSQEPETDRALDAVQWHQLHGSDLFGVPDAETTAANRDGRGNDQRLDKSETTKGRQIKDKSSQKLPKARKSTSGPLGDLTSNITSSVPEAVMGVRKIA